MSYAFSFLFFLFKKIFYLFIFRERRREGEREGEKHQCVVASPVPSTGGPTWPATQACALTGKRTGDPLVFGLVLHPLNHASQGSFLLFHFIQEVFNDLSEKIMHPSIEL